jgi:O-antigen/teichoic acid export membrane protein
VLGGLVGWLAGPEVVALLFGEEFAPSSTVAMFTAAGVMAAAAAQIAGQVLVAEGRTSRLSAAWFGGLLVGVVTLLLLGSEPDVRVAMAFAIGEVVALILMAGLAVRR